MRVMTKDVAHHVGKEITVSGWVHRIRELGGISFVVLRDRSGQIQLVQEGKVDFTLETVIQAWGRVQANEKSPGGVELVLERWEVLGAAAPELPFPVNQDPAQTSLEVILDNRSLSLRNPKLRSIFEVQSSVCHYFADYLRSQDFTEVKTPKIVSTGAEGGTGLFEVEYFENKVYLAQSPQLYKQTMISSGMERVFEVGAAYRAEKHETSRHLNEYISLDVEMAFIDTEADLIELEKGILAHIFEGVARDNAEALALWGATVPTRDQVMAYPTIGHEEAKKIVSERLGHRIFEINPEAEREITAWAMENHGCDGVFINDFPRKKRPFYAYPSGLKTLSFDLVFRGIEITSGGRRINDYQMLRDTLPKFGLTEEGLGQFYVDIFKYGCPPHGGFAIGLERLTQKILGLNNVKEAALFPRDRRRISP